MCHTLRCGTSFLDICANQALTITFVLIMILDVVGILLILLFFIRGYMKGIIVAAFSVLAILLGILVSLKLSQAFSAWLLEKGWITSGWVQVISYIVLFIGVYLIVRLIAKLIQKAVEGMMLGMINKVIGGLLYAFLGAVLWGSFLWIGDKMHIITPETIAASKTYPMFSRLAPWFFEQAGKLLPFVRDTFEKLEHFFNHFNPKPDVGTH
jgi:membrane protein required for colicin V production